MAVTNLKCEARTAVGTKQVARLRESGKVPAIVYGGPNEPQNLSIDVLDVERELRHHRRVFTLDLAGAQQGVYLQDAQFDVMSDEALHLDFIRIDLAQDLKLDIRLVFSGHAKGVAKGGSLVKDMLTVPLSCKSDSVPHSVEVLVGDMDLGSEILCKEIKLPEGCTLNCSEDAIAVHMPEEEERPDLEEEEGEEA